MADSPRRRRSAQAPPTPHAPSNTEPTDAELPLPERIVRLYNERHPVKRISALAGCSERYVRQVLKARNLPSPSNRKGESARTVSRNVYFNDDELALAEARAAEAGMLLAVYMRTLALRGRL